MEASFSALVEAESVRLECVLLHISEVGDGGIATEGAGDSCHKRDKGNRSEERLIHIESMKREVDKSYEGE
jgi:hypothetical protein